MRFVAVVEAAEFEYAWNVVLRGEYQTGAACSL